MPASTSCSDKRNLPMALLMAISESDIALISSTTSLFSNAALALPGMRSGESTARMNVTVSRSSRALWLFSMCSPGCSLLLARRSQHRVHLILRHGMPPVRVIDFDPAPERSESGFLAGAVLCADQIHHGQTAAADGDWLAALRDLNQFRKLILCPATLTCMASI